MSKGWIGVDLDGTLAKYDGWKGSEHIGEPIPLMVDRVKGWIAQGREVRIMTARAHDALDWEIEVIQAWTEKHIGHRLKVTNCKDMHMIALYDDRAFQVIANTGQVVKPPGEYAS